MHHKEHNTLDLLEQFTHNTQTSSNKSDDNENRMFQELVSNEVLNWSVENVI